jgi:glucuronokinase
VDAASTPVPARTGLAGHPSDVSGGAVLTTPIAELAATVTVEPADAFVIGDRHFADLASLLETEHGGESMLLSAAVARLASWVRERGSLPRASGFAMTWHTTIPRSVGLGGSSALVISALRSVAALWGVAIPDDVGPRLALEVEADLLGIAAGPHDRVVQWHGATVLMELGSEPWLVRAIRTPAPVDLFVCWTDVAGRSSHETHAPLQARRNDPDVRDHMRALAALAREAAAALEAGDVGALGHCMDDGFEHRRALVSLDPAHVELVEDLRRLGAAATYTGSGGAAVAVAPDLGPLRGWAAARGLRHLSTTIEP